MEGIDYSIWSVKRDLYVGLGSFLVKGRQRINRMRRYSYMVRMSDQKKHKQAVQIGPADKRKNKAANTPVE